MGMFGKYELGRLLGRGGFSEVYLARYNAIDGFEKVLVVKIMLPAVASSPEFIDLFISEARITAQLEHPNIVHVFDFGKVRDSYFMAMEYIRGLTLSELGTRCREKGEQIPVEIALHVVHEMAMALSYAHNSVDSQGRSLHAVHRDVNPRNVFITWDGNVKIADFGMVGIRKVAEAFKGKAVGTMGYMSPEQAMGEPTDAATDIYATGLILYGMVTGRSAFDTRDDEKCIVSMARSEFTAAHKAAPWLPREVAGIIEKATKRKKADRYSSAEEMAEAISSVLYDMGRITNRSVAEFVRRFREHAAPPPLPSEGSALHAIAEASFYFLVRGQSDPLGPLPVREVRAMLAAGELTGFEKASLEGVRWMRWKYFPELKGLTAEGGRTGVRRPAPVVLMISTDPQIAMGVGQDLVASGFDVHEVGEVGQVHDECVRHRPDALLTDVMTAGLGGFELMKSLRADPQTAGIPVVLMSPI
ncbi:MAG: serine/threonine-protein kinase, partial [Myxococcota bacterium]